MSDEADANTTGEHRSLAGQVADCFVYAPLGLAFEARTLFPSLVEKGRNQVMVAKMLGKFAVQQGSHAGKNAVIDLGTQAVSRLPGVDLDSSSSPDDEQPAHAATERTTVPPEAADEEPVPAADEEGFVAPAEAAATAGAPLVDGSTLAIPDYDSLSALQVVPRLDGLTKAELEAVGTYEAATRGRKTILNKVAQLQSS